MTYTLRRTWPDKTDDYEVFVEGKASGRMYLKIAVRGGTCWHWTIYGTSLAGQPHTFDEAKVEWKRAFEDWIRQKQMT
jgi:hypothetical protein